MLETERVRHQPIRGLAYATVGAAVILVCFLVWDANGMAVNERPKIQRAGAGSW